MTTTHDHLRDDAIYQFPSLPDLQILDFQSDRVEQVLHQSLVRFVGTFDRQFQGVCTKVQWFLLQK